MRKTLTKLVTLYNLPPLLILCSIGIPFWDSGGTVWETPNGRLKYFNLTAPTNVWMRGSYFEGTPRLSREPLSVAM